MRPIDADELKKALAEMWYESAAELIDEAPTIEPSGDLISRAEVFEIIDKAFSQPMRDGNTIYADICLMLNVLPTHANSRSTHDTDLISRVEALDVVCKELQYQEENRIPYDSYDSGTCYGLKTARELLLALPSAEQTIIGIDIPYGSDKGLATVFKSKDDKLILEKVKEICLDDFADRPTLKQTDTMIIADALRYLAKDTERHLVDRTRADALRQQFLKYGASMCKGGAE